MEQTTAFVLGIATGGLIILMIGLITTILKIKKQVKEAQSDIVNSLQEISSLNDRTHDDLNDFYVSLRKELTQVNDDLQLINDDLRVYVTAEINRLERNEQNSFNTISSRADSISNYVDKRADQITNTLQTYCDKRLHEVLVELQMIKNQNIIENDQLLKS